MSHRFTDVIPQERRQISLSQNAANTCHERPIVALSHSILRLTVWCRVLNNEPTAISEPEESSADIFACIVRSQTPKMQ